MQLCSTTEIPGMLLKGRLKKHWAKDNTREPAFSELFDQQFRFNKRSSEYLKGTCGATALTELSAFEQAYAGIDGSRVQRRHVRRWHNPWQSCMINHIFLCQPSM